MGKKNNKKISKAKAQKMIDVPITYGQSGYKLFFYSPFHHSTPMQELVALVVLQGKQEHQMRLAAHKLLFGV